MFKKVFGPFVVLPVLAFALLASPPQARASILPDNNLESEDGLVGGGNITEEQFNLITDTVVNLWKPLAAIRGANLEAVKQWDNPMVNAKAAKNGNNWYVYMLGD